MEKFPDPAAEMAITSCPSNACDAIELIVRPEREPFSIPKDCRVRVF
jgi:hypothetical protein